MSNQYFAALEKDKIAAELNKRVDAFYQYVQTNGLLKKWRKAYLSYYGQNNTKSSYQINSGGKQGELSELVSNEYRNLISHLLVLTTTSRPAMEARAANTDYESQVQCILANGLLEYYMRESKLERYLKLATEISLVLDAGYLSVTWDTTLGKEIAVNPDTGEVIRDGDIKYNALTPLDVIYDFNKRSAEDHEWYIVRDYKNKFDLAAQFPEYADDIIRIGRDLAREEVYRYDNFFSFQGLDSPEIPVYTFYHRKSPALPNGRIVQFVSPQIVLFDGPIPYRKLPIVRIAPGEMIARPFGYSPGTDLLALQDVVDALISAVTTNTTTFGVSNIWCQPGHNLEVTQIAQGMNLFESQTKPEPVNFAQFPPELMNFMEFCIKRMETLSGVNSTARGTPPSAQMSGSALALIQSMALQFNSGLQQSYAQLLEDSGQLTINHLQDFANSPRIAMIAGKHSAFEAKTFSNQDISDIQRVFVDMGNPLSKTVSGRLSIAQDLLKNQLIKTADQYLSVLSTGRLEPLIEDTQSELLNIRSENEVLSNGDVPPVVITDDHRRHIEAHKHVIGNPEARKNPQIVQAVTQHIQDHINALKTGDPQLLQLLGQQPLIQPPTGPLQVPPPQMPPKPMPQGGPKPPIHVLTNENPLTQAAQKVNQPNMPKNALTGQPFDLQTGGLQH